MRITHTLVRLTIEFVFLWAYTTVYLWRRTVSAGATQVAFCYYYCNIVVSEGGGVLKYVAGEEYAWWWPIRGKNAGNALVCCALAGCTRASARRCASSFRLVASYQIGWATSVAACLSLLVELVENVYMRCKVMICCFIHNTVSV